MVDSVGLKSIASSLLADNGQSLTFSRETSSGFDPATGINTTTTSTYTGYGAGFGYAAREIDGSVIKKGDIRLILEATDTAPLNGDTVVYDSETYRVMDIEKVKPATIAVLYKLQLRR